MGPINTIKKKIGGAVQAVDQNVVQPVENFVSNDVVQPAANFVNNDVVKPIASFATPTPKPTAPSTMSPIPTPTPGVGSVPKPPSANDFFSSIMPHVHSLYHSAASDVHDITHNPLTDVAGNLVGKPFIENPAQNVIEAGRGIAADVTNNPAAETAGATREMQNVRSSLPGQIVSNAYNIGKANTVDLARQTAGDLTGNKQASDNANDSYMQDINRSAIGGLLNIPERKLAADQVERDVVPQGHTMKDYINADLANVDVNPTADKSSQVLSTIGGGLQLAAPTFGIAKAAVDGTPFENYLKGATFYDMAKNGAQSAVDAVKSIPQTLRNTAVKNAATDLPVQSIPTKNLINTDLQGYGELDPVRVDAYKQQISRGQPISPLLAMQGSDGQLHIEDGKHRLEALNQLGIKNAPVKIVTPDDIKRIAQGGYARIPGANAYEPAPGSLDNESTNIPKATNDVSAETPSPTPNSQVSLPNNTPILSHEEATTRALQNGTTPLYEMANNILSNIDRSKPAQAKAVEARTPTVSENVETPQQQTADYTPQANNRLDQITKEYAGMLQSLDSGAHGGQMVPDGSGGYKRVTDHSPFYSQFFAANRRVPTADDYAEEAWKQLESGRADPYIQKEYSDIKNNNGYFDSLFKSEPQPQSEPNDSTTPYWRDAKQEAMDLGMQPKMASAHEIAQTMGIMPSKADALANIDKNLSDNRLSKVLFKQRQKATEQAVLDQLRQTTDRTGKDATDQAVAIYKHLMGDGVKLSDNAIKAAVKRLQDRAEKAPPENPMKMDVPKVEPGDYTRARSNPQFVSSMIQNRLAQALPAINRLTHEDKINFWKTVEGTQPMDKAEDPRAMGLAVSRWRDVANTVHALNKTLGGKTPYIENYARHNWDVSDPDAMAKMQKIINDRQGGYVDPYDFAGVNRIPRVFENVQEGENAGFKLTNPDSPAKDVLDYANGATTALEKQALVKSFTEADAGEELKNRAYDLRNGYTLPLSEKGLKQIRGYQYPDDPNKLNQFYRKANKTVKQTLLSVSLFHPLNINMFQAAPTLAMPSFAKDLPITNRAHPIYAIKGVGRSWAGLFNPKFSENMHQKFLDNGTTEWAAKMGTPIRQGSDFSASGHLVVGKNTVFERAIFDRSIAMMQGTMVQAARSDLESRGLRPDSPEALHLGLEINKIMGFVNKEVENRMVHSNTVSSNLLLAPQFTRAKWSVLKDAFTKWGGLEGSYARRAVIGKYVAEAVLAVTAGAIVGQKTDNMKDILLRTLIHPAIPTPFKDSKGNNIKLSMPQNYISEATGLVGDLGRGDTGHMTVNFNPKNIPGNVEQYARSRLAVLPQNVLDTATNTDFAGNPVRDTTQGYKDQAVESFINMVKGDLPIGAQAIPQAIATNPSINGHLPADVRDSFKVNDSGGNQYLKAAASSLGFTPGTDTTTGTGLQTKQYFDALDNAGSGLNRQEKDALDLYTGSKKDPVTGQYQIAPSVYDSPTKAEALLQNPKVIDRLQQMNQSLQDKGQSIDPLWWLSKDQITKYLQFETINKNNTGQLAVWQQQNASWYPTFTQERQNFFDSLPAADPNKPQESIQPPTETPEITGLFNQYNALTDPTQKAQFLQNNSDLTDYLDADAQYKNKLLSAQGLTPLKTYPTAPKPVQDWMTQYNAADKPTRTSMRNANPSMYQQMAKFYDSIDLYNIGEQSATNRLQGQPDSNSKENKDISSLSQDIYTNPDGTFSIIPAGWMGGLTSAASGPSYKSSSSKRIYIRKTSPNLGGLREDIASTSDVNTNTHRYKGPNVKGNVYSNGGVHSSKSGKTYGRADEKVKALKRLLS